MIQFNDKSFCPFELFSLLFEKVVQGKQSSRDQEEKPIIDIKFPL